MKHNTHILEQFQPEVVEALIEFGKSLSRIDADVLVFMARKSLCLYDLLLLFGVPPIQRCIVSDRVIDMRLDPLRGKRVALIDDTLIVGTTLARTKALLERELGAAVTVHAFCADTKWWCRELIQPDTLFLEMSDDRVMSFCAGLVRALSLIPRPYIVDFPVSHPIRVYPRDRNSLLSSIEWSVHKIDTELQARHGVNVYTFFPSESLLAELGGTLGTDFINCLDIIKVRAFTRWFDDVGQLKLVPIVTLKPLTERSVARILDNVLERSLGGDSSDSRLLQEAAHTSHSRQRLVQYALSAALGQRFMMSTRQSLRQPSDFRFDQTETDRHYGPWLREPLSRLSERAFSSLMGVGSAKRRSDLDSIKPAMLPKAVRSWALDSLREPPTTVSRVSGKRQPPRASRTRNLVSDFNQIFIALYNTRELPAREEAKNLDPSKLTRDDNEPPLRHRLMSGIPWSVLVSQLCNTYGVKSSRSVSDLFSLVLDLCNDLGVAVPITCVSDGVVYRAYRHGEDVRFADGELALARHAIRGFLTTSARDTMPRLVLEKLLVMLIRVGTKQGFLDPLYGPSGVEGTVRIGFELKGAVPKFRRGARDRADREIWLTDYMVQRGVLVVDKKTRHFTVGSDIEGNYITPNAPRDAYSFGSLIGLLLRNADRFDRQDAPLDENRITVLATCWYPRHAAAALQAELDIFQQWFQDYGRAMIGKVQLNNIESVRKCVAALVRAPGHEAVHSARLKYVGYRSGMNEETIAAARDYLQRTQPVDILSEIWSGYWDTESDLKFRAEHEEFSPWIDQCAAMCWELAMLLGILECALRVRQREISGQHTRAPVLQAFQKVVEYYDDMIAVAPETPSSLVTLSCYFSAMRRKRIDEFDALSAYSDATRLIERRLTSIASLVETLDPVVTEYGRLNAKYEYHFMLYYDIIDSTAEVNGNRGRNVEEYRAKVRQFKQQINQRIHRMSREARNSSAEIFCMHDKVFSMDDEKQIFVRGRAPRKLLQDVFRVLIQTSLAFPDIRMRVIMVPCTFAGTGAYRYGNGTEVEGERFWEHWSRLHRALKSVETSVPEARIILFVAMKRLINVFELPAGVEWSGVQEVDVRSEIELLGLSTRVRYGGVRFSTGQLELFAD